MALSSGAITFSQIAAEWSETSWADSIPYSAGSPMSMRQFLRGASISVSGAGGTGIDPSGFVPNNYQTTGGVPSSGNFSLRTLAGTQAESDAQTCLTGFYSYRGYYSRNTGSTGSYPGDSVRINNHYNRYQSSVSILYNYPDSSGSIPGYSKWTTVLDWCIGAQNYLTSWTGMNGSNNNFDMYYTQNQSSYGEMSCVVSHYRDIARHGGGPSLQYTRLGNNSGSWTGNHLLPGKWYVVQVRNQPVTNSSAGGPQTSYVVTVPAGQAYLLTSYSTGGNTDVTGGQTPYSSDGAAVIQTVNWWYNASVAVFYVNITGSDQTLTFPNGLMPNYDKGNNFLQNTGGFWFGTNYHRDLFLTRTY